MLFEIISYTIIGILFVTSFAFSVCSYRENGRRERSRSEILRDKYGGYHGGYHC